MAIIECVPNFSEGRDLKVIEKIVAAISASPGVYILHVDSGFSANRTVVTFAGEPEAVIEGAFQGIKEAAEQIDMLQHKGIHPRIGATDVCPLIPVSGIALEEVIPYAQALGKRVGEELQIPVYLYEFAASRPERTNLAAIRKGGFEKLALKLQQENWIPDYGQPPFHPSAGSAVIGVRDFLLAYNVNLNTHRVEAAKEIAAEVRFSGKQLAGSSPIDKRIALPYTKAIGWYVEEYDIAQVSMNLTKLSVTPVHLAFEAVKKAAAERDLRVTGSELIGLAPLQSLLDAGRYYKTQNGGPPEKWENSALIAEAIQSLGLGELKPFDPRERVLEYAMHKNGFSL